MSANENRRIKGIACEYLQGIGYQIYANDSSSNIIIVQTDARGVNQLNKLFDHNRWERTTPTTWSVFIHFGKPNARRLWGYAELGEYSPAFL